MVQDFNANKPKRFHRRPRLQATAPDSDVKAEILLLWFPRLSRTISLRVRFHPIGTSTHAPPRHTGSFLRALTWRVRQAEANERRRAVSPPPLNDSGPVLKSALIKRTGL